MFLKCMFLKNLLLRKIILLYFVFVLQDSLVLYARLQLNFARDAADSSLLVEQLLDIVCKELDQSFLSSCSVPWLVFCFCFSLSFFFFLSLYFWFGANTNNTESIPTLIFNNKGFNAFSSSTLPVIGICGCNCRGLWEGVSVLSFTAF